MTTIPTAADPTAALQWLLDRAALSDLLVEFARALEGRDWHAYARTYTEDGTLEVPDAFRFAGREQMATAGEHGLGRYAPSGAGR